MSDPRRPLVHDDSPNPSNIDINASTSPTPILPSLGFPSGSHSSGFFHTPQDSPSSPPSSRPGYTRLSTNATAVERNTPSTVLEEGEEDIAHGFRSQPMGGLGIQAGVSPASPPAPSRRVSVTTIPRRSFTSSMKSPPMKSPGYFSPPNTGDPFLGGFPRSVESTPDLKRDRFSPSQDGGDYEEYRRGGLKRSTTSLTEDYQHYLDAGDTQRLRGAPSIKSAYENPFRPTQECPTVKDFYHSRFTWVSITIVIICLFSTVFSGIFLGLALKAPRYGRQITSQGSFKPADAILLTSIMAKLIELSFVTSFVAFLGQVLSRRAFMKEQGRGVTLSELSMWRWVVQPGTLITHWETALYAGLSALGILSLLSAVLATMYTAAATALVQPMLKQGHWDHVTMAGRVKTEFANINYLKDTCETPITADMDKANAGSACLQIEHAGQGYHNYQRYLSYWHQASSLGNGTSEMSKRPLGFGLLHENTTILPQWINIIDTVAESKKHGRGINRVSLAFPHAGVFAAARDQRNDILQPEELNSEGTYSIRASVPSPVLNVDCANLNREELKPIVYDEWDNDRTVDINSWPLLWGNATTTNKTVVDDFFGWTKQDKTLMSDYPPVFARLPKAYNTIMNHSSYAWNRSAIYFLGSGGLIENGPNLTGTYAVCKMYMTLTVKCLTQYNATGSGGTMEALCEDKADDMVFSNSNRTANDSRMSTNWRDVGFDWANSMSLNTGIMDADASNSRILTQLILRNNTQGEINLDPALPSPAEALAVMSGCTLLMSSLDAPFVMDWNYTQPLLGDFQTQYFNASVSAQQYASGGVDRVSKAWIIILILVFLMNILVLTYFLVHKGLVTDFSEPPNLFALAVNSPPSHLLAGSCGGGPEGKQYVVNWFVNTEGDHLYMEPGQKGLDEQTHPHSHPHSHGHSHRHPADAGAHASGSGRSTAGGGWLTDAKGKWNLLRRRGLGWGKGNGRADIDGAGMERTRQSMIGDELELEGGNSGRHSKTQRTYAKLSKRTSVL